MTGKDFDCIVVGFGTAGGPAALAAARNGAKVLVLERGNAPGGTHTAGFIWGYYDKAGTGILREADEATGKDISIVENKKILLEQELLALGGIIEYEAAVTDVEREGEKILSLTFLREDGSLHKVTADTFIDGTADGYFSILAGAEMFGGRASDGVFQPYTNSMGIVDPINEVACDNFDAGRIDPYSEPQYSGHLLFSMLAHCHEDYSSFRRSLIISHVPGLREGLHVKTRETATFSDLVEKGKVASTPILTIRSNIDAHTRDMALESELLQEWMIGCSLWGEELYITVPYGTIFAAGVKNLLVAGRHFGVDHDLGHALRMNGCMGAIGECAGIVAGLSAKTGKNINDISYEEVAPLLPPSPYPPGNNDKSLRLPQEDVWGFLATDKIGPALWTARNHIPGATLRKWYDEAEERSDLQKHLAFALALQRDPYGVELLRDMAKGRDPFAPTHSRKYNHERGYTSVFFLGLLKDRESIGLLLELLDEKGEKGFEYATLSLMALIKIGDLHGEEREKIGAKLRLLAEDPSWELDAKLKGYTERTKRLDLFFRLMILKTLEKWAIAHKVRESFAKLSPDPFEKFLMEKSV